VLEPPPEQDDDGGEDNSGGGAAAVLEHGKEAMLRMVADFCAAINEGRPPMSDGREGRRSLSVVRAVYESAATGQPVELL
jgi:UDP-N-acetyl-2-amino-2-deoxyglucuronate dehydrogenase